MEMWKVKACMYFGLGIRKSVGWGGGSGKRMWIDAYYSDNVEGDDGAWCEVYRGRDDNIGADGFSESRGICE